MASVSNDGNGLRRIQFMLNGQRRAIRLGQCNAKDASTICGHVEALLSAKLSGQPVAALTAAWIGALGDTPFGDMLHNRLAAVGLVEPRQAAVSATLGELLAKYEELQLSHAKPATAIFYGHTKRNLIEHFGEQRTLASITPLDADGFRAFLKSQELAAATINRRIVATKTLFRRAVRWGMITTNAFDGVVGGNSANEARKHFVSQADTLKLLDACPSPEWRALVALSRFGGLRIPSEADGLTWADVNWEKGTLHVKSPKTEHHAGQASRTVPLFPELRKALLEAFEAAEPGGEPWVIAKHRGAGVNLRTQLERIILRAGLTPWPKLWHNMRASRQSELMAEYDLSTACRWLGNSPTVAARHYAMSTDTDGAFNRAVAGPESTPVEAAQKAAQYGAVLPSIASHAESDDMQKPQYLPGNADTCESIHMEILGVEGLEPSTLRV